MPGRSHPLVTGQYYHVFNKTIDGKRPLETVRMIQKFKHIAWYYRSESTPVRFADYVKAPESKRISITKTILSPGTFRVLVLAYCFMPTHFHFLLKQQSDGGISMFTAQIQNSFTRYFNTAMSRKGPLFMSRFRSRPIESDADLKHISRYIHLNPYSSGLTDDVDAALKYQGSSFVEISNLPLSTNLTPEEVPYIDSGLENYDQFVTQNAEYQKELESIEK